MNSTDNDSEPEVLVIPQKTLLSERIASARMAIGYSQAELATKLGVQLSSIQNWENERTAPRSNLMGQLAGILNVSLVWLMSGGESYHGDLPHLEETAQLSRKIQHAENLLSELSGVLSDLKTQANKLQDEFDA